MKALIYRGPNDFRVEDKPIPNIGRGEVLLKVKACGICGTDIKIFNFGHRRIKKGLTTGHEIVGQIIKAKSQKRDIKVGDHVIVVTPVGCMRCRFCLAGKQNMCSRVVEEAYSIGYYVDGGFAEYIKIPKEAVNQNALIKIPAKTNIPIEHFSLCEPLSCVINGQEKLKITSTDTVVIIGAGPIGCMHAFLAKAIGVKKIIMVDINKKKLNLVKHIPANIFIDAKKQNVKKIVYDETGAMGADVVIVAASSINAQELAILLAARQGRISFFGGLPGSNPVIKLRSNLIHYKELELFGAYASNNSQYKKALSLILKKKINTGRIITHLFRLKEIKKAITTIQKGVVIKALIIP